MKRHTRGVANKSVPHQIYLKPGVAEDDLLDALWDATHEVKGRIQPFFRALLLDGLRRQMEMNAIPPDVMAHPAVTEALARTPDIAALRGRLAGRHATAAQVYAPPPPPPPAETPDVSRDVPPAVRPGTSGKGLDKNLM